MTGLDPIQRNVLIEGVEDDVGLWQIVGDVRERLPIGSADDIRLATLKLLEPLLVGDYIRAGLGPYQCLDGGFQVWDEEAQAALDRIDREWLALTRDPTLEDVWRFRNTGRGDRLALRLLRRPPGALL